MKIKLNTLEGFKKERKMVFWSPVELDVGKSTLKGWGINFFFKAFYSYSDASVLLIQYEKW